MVPIDESVTKLSESELRELQGLLAEFEHSWDEGRLEEHARALPPPENPLRRLALGGMVAIDLRKQWERGRQASVESYLESHPELGPMVVAPSELLRAEIAARRDAGAPADLESFVRRFPERHEELRELLAAQDAAATLPTARPGRGTHPSGPAAAPVELPEHFGRYHVLNKLGCGAMGSVYLAHDTQLDRPVALKVPHFSSSESPHLQERFFREARAAATLSHPNLCPVYDVGEIDGIPFLTMAFLEGDSLAELVGKSGPPLPQAPVAAVIRKLALALAEAHRRGVVHRDLKPANIMMNRDHEPVIMDFGLAWRVEREKERLTKAGAILGTPAYMPPEQVEGDLDATGPACDIYSLGVILYELLTGRLPFQGSPGSVLGQIMSRNPEPPSRHRPDIARELEAVCLKAMAKKIGHRYASMSDMAAALERYLRSVDPAASELASDKAAASPGVGAPTLQRAQESRLARFYADLASQFYAKLAQASSLRRRRATKRPSRLRHWLAVLAVSLLAAALGGLTLWSSRRHEGGESKVAVRLHLHGVAANDPDVCLYLNGLEVSAAQLSGLVSLPVGHHELRVHRGEAPPEIRTFTIAPEDAHSVVRVATPHVCAPKPAVIPPVTNNPPAASVPSPKVEPAQAELSATGKALVQALTDEDPSVRRGAAESLGRLKDRAAVAALVKRVGDNVWASGPAGPNDPEGGGKAAALAALKLLAPNRVTEALIGGLDSQDRHVRAWAAAELNRLGDKAAVPSLVRRVADDVWAASPGEVNEARDAGKTEALDALRFLGPERVREALLVALSSKDEHVRAWAATELATTMDKAVLAVLAARLTDGYPAVRKAAAETLAKVGDQDAVPALVQRVGDDVWVSSVNGLNDPRDGGKEAALGALKQLAPQRVTEALIPGLRSPHPRQRAWSAVELGKNRDRAAVPALMQRVADDVWGAGMTGHMDPRGGGKADALAALKLLAPAKAPEALLEAMKSKNKAVKAWATTELGRVNEK